MLHISLALTYMNVKTTHSFRMHYLFIENYVFVCVYIPILLRET